jgi:serine phosphatase RsbU (regulator of sigma subunit)
MNGPAIGGALAGVFLVVWILVTVIRKGQLAAHSAGGTQARHALTEFSEYSLELQTVHEVLSLAREAAAAIFGSERVVAFETGAEPGSWDASVPGIEALGEVPAATRGLFGWFKHNTSIAAESELGEARFGAMRNPLRSAMASYKVDVLMPLVNRGSVLAVLGIQLGRRPTSLDRDLMRLFRLQATAACANVRLHREAAHVYSLAREVDLASAVKLALVPDNLEGRLGRTSWAGHFKAAGDAGSDFWSVYPMGNRLVFLIGDAVGAGLAGSMVSAVVKSCADSIFDSNPTRLDPGAMLSALNRSLYRSQNPVHASCFAVLLDPDANKLYYSNAGHDIPYHLRFSGSGDLGVLKGAGPLLGDGADAKYPPHEIDVGGEDVFVFFTDGLIEAKDEKGEPFGERRFQRLLQKVVPTSATEVRDQLLGGITKFRGGARLVDDAALLVVKLS